MCVHIWEVRISVVKCWKILLKYFNRFYRYDPKVGSRACRSVCITYICASCIFFFEILWQFASVTRWRSYGCIRIFKARNNLCSELWWDTSDNRKSIWHRKRRSSSTRLLSSQVETVILDSVATTVKHLQGRNIMWFNQHNSHGASQSLKKLNFPESENHILHEGSYHCLPPPSLEEIWILEERESLEWENPIQSHLIQPFLRFWD